MTVLQLPEKSVFIFFVATCLTAPALGVGLSIFVYNRIGGYNSKKAFIVSLVFGCMAITAAIPVPFANTQALIFILFWLIFFFGSMILAPLVGMMLNTVP